MRKLFSVIGVLILMSTTLISAQEKVGNAIIMEVDDFLLTNVFDLTGSESDIGDFSLSLGSKYGYHLGDNNIYNQSYFTIGSSVELGSALNGLIVLGDMSMGMMNFRYSDGESPGGYFLGFDVSLLDYYFLGTNYYSVEGINPFWEKPNVSVLFGLFPSRPEAEGQGVIYIKNSIKFTLQENNLRYFWRLGVGIKRNLNQDE